MTEDYPEPGSDYDLDNIPTVPDVRDVVRSTPDMLDPTTPPPAKQCKGCGVDLPFVWWHGRGPIGPRWTFPKPCAKCEYMGQIRAASTEMQRRQEASGIPVKHRRHRWAWTVLQDPKESWATFAAAVRAHEGGTPRIGIARADAETANALRRWEPAHGSMYLHGPVGSGKSLWCAARVTDLLEPTEEGEVELGELELVERGVPESMAPIYVATGRNRFRKPGGLQTYGVQFVDEEEIVRRQQLAWAGDRVPLLGIARADVLVYDDLGAVLVGGMGKSRELAARCVAQLVDLRWREERPMLITSNRPLEDLASGDHLDRRTVDRLHEMIGDRQFAMVGVPEEHVEAGYSWRRPPPIAPEGPKPTERKRQAAGEDW
jgi:DNA replication protein DnaC